MERQMLEVGSQAGVARPSPSSSLPTGGATPAWAGVVLACAPSQRASAKTVLRALAASQQSLTRFCKERGLSAVTVSTWRCKQDGSTAPLVHRHRFDPDQKRQTVETYLKSGLTQSDLAWTWGLDVQDRHRRVRAWRCDGPKALEGKRVGRPQGTGTGNKLPVAVQAQIVDTRRRFPDFGAAQARAVAGALSWRAHEHVRRGAVLREDGVAKRTRATPASSSRIRSFLGPFGGGRTL